MMVLEGRERQPVPLFHNGKEELANKNYKGENK